MTKMSLTVWARKNLFPAEDVHELRSAVRETRAAAGDEIDVARHVELANLHFFHPAVLDFPLHTHARDDGHAHAHLHEAFDAFNGGHFDGHVERGAVAGEQLDDAAAEGRFYDMGDEILLSEVGDVDFTLAGESVLRRNDGCELVLEDFRSEQLWIARHIRNGAEVEAVVQNFVGNVAGKHTMNADLNARVEFAEFGEGREMRMDGAFVDAEREFAALEAFELGEAFFDFVAQVDEALGVVSQEDTGVGETYRARASHKKRLAYGIFQLADRQAHRGLRAVQTLAGAR